jgi:hypothetical protein
MEVAECSYSGRTREGGVIEVVKASKPRELSEVDVRRKLPCLCYVSRILGLGLRLIRPQRLTPPWPACS